MSQFYKYFRENMHALGLPAPENLFGTKEAAITAAKAILVAFDKLGPKATVGELIGATTRYEKFLVVSAMSGAYVIGAIIGSIAVATGRCISGGTSLGDVLHSALANGTYRPWLMSTLMKRPVIYDQKITSRRLLAQLARRT
jgi:hypothetical protein